LNYNTSEWNYFFLKPRDDPLEAGQLLSRVAALEVLPHFEPQFFGLRVPLRFEGKWWWSILSRIGALGKIVFGDLPSQPPPMRVAALEALKSPLSSYKSSAALREKVQGTMVNGSPSGDNVFGQSSPAAKADEIYSSSDKITTGRRAGHKHVRRAGHKHAGVGAPAPQFV
jgi:hypothetical protein